MRARCCSGTPGGTDAQKLSRTCQAGPSGSTAYVRDADGNNQGLSASSVTYTNRNQVANIDGLAQDYLDQGNDLRTSTGGTRVINGPLGVTAYKAGGQTVLLSRDPAGNLMTFRPSTGTSLYYLTEPNGNVAGATDPFGYLVATYQYSPYGKTTTTGLGQFNPFRYLGAWQETNAAGDPGHYKLGARFYNTNGMFTQPDALTGNLGDPRTMTSYNYGDADPINRADPSGYFDVPIPQPPDPIGFFKFAAKRAPVVCTVLRNVQRPSRSLTNPEYTAGQEVAGALLDVAEDVRKCYFPYEYLGGPIG